MLQHLFQLSLVSQLFLCSMELNGTIFGAPWYWQNYLTCTRAPCFDRTISSVPCCCQSSNSTRSMPSRGRWITCRNPEQKTLGVNNKLFLMYPNVYLFMFFRWSMKFKDNSVETNLQRLKLAECQFTTVEKFQLKKSKGNDYEIWQKPRHFGSFLIWAEFERGDIEVGC